MLHLLPTAIFGKLLAAKAAFRLRVSKQLTNTRIRPDHSCILVNYSVPGKSDYVVPFRDFKVIYKTRIPIRIECESAEILNSSATEILPDGSKTAHGTEVDVFSNSPNINITIRLQDYRILRLLIIDRKPTSIIYRRHIVKSTSNECQKTAKGYFIYSNQLVIHNNTQYFPDTVGSNQFQYHPCPRKPY